MGRQVTKQDVAEAFEAEHVAIVEERNEAPPKLAAKGGRLRPIIKTKDGKPIGLTDHGALIAGLLKREGVEAAVEGKRPRIVRCMWMNCIKMMAARGGIAPTWCPEHKRAHNAEMCREYRAKNRERELARLREWARKRRIEQGAKPRVKMSPEALRSAQRERERRYEAKNRDKNRARRAKRRADLRAAMSSDKHAHLREAKSSSSPQATRDYAAKWRAANRDRTNERQRTSREIAKNVAAEARAKAGCACHPNGRHKKVCPLANHIGSGRPPAAANAWAGTSTVNRRLRVNQ